MRAWAARACLAGVALALAGAAPARAGPPTDPREAPLSVDECVLIAIGGSPEIEQAQAKVRALQARLAEVESVYYPKVDATLWVAPNYTVEGSALEPEVRTHWEHIEDWGTTVHLDGRVVQPLWTFGRSAAGEEAAGERIEAERARVREAQVKVAYQVRRLWYDRLYALSLIPAFESALDTLHEAERLAEEQYEAGTGDVTLPDRMQLRYGVTELEKALRNARDGAELATWALAHTMGLAHDARLAFTEERLPPVPEGALPGLPTLWALARAKRPEWAQAHHGARAATAWRLAEARANHPVLFAAAQLEVDWTPTRTDATNPYHYDKYNGITGGVAIGLKWDFDPALAAAKAHGAGATEDEVAALTRLAETGIPLQVRKARQELEKARAIAALATEGATATRKWVTFAAAAYNAGTGEARDVLEGVGAHARAQRDRYEAIRNYHVARAALDQALGIMMEEEE